MTLAGQQLGHYRLVRLIGQGGMGEVYLAEDTRIPRQVAVKVVRTEPQPHPSTDALREAKRLFQREMKAISQLDHPHILGFHDFGEQPVATGSLIYMVMPYRPEGSLVDWLIRQGSNQLPPQDVGYIIAQAASALQHAHDRNIIHQDVKPSNFLVRINTDRPTRPDLFLVDFGIARVISATSSASNNIRGTSSYMAPEQWSGDAVPASDQYALAIMSYQLLAGQLPFQGRPEQMMFQHLTVPPKPPSELNASLSPAIDAVILRGLAKKSDERFPTIKIFALALQQALDYTDQRAMLAISKAEALEGGNRAVTLSDGRQVTVIIPPGTHHGQVLHLPGLGALYYNGGLRGPLQLTLSVDQDKAMPFPANTGKNDLPTMPASGNLVKQPPSTTYTDPLPHIDKPESIPPAVLAPPPRATQPALASPITPPPDSIIPAARLLPDTDTMPPPPDYTTGNRSKPLKQRALLFITIALLLIVSSLVVITSVNNTIATNNANATATALSIADNNATATAQAQATALSIADSNATATAHAQATATTTAANPDPYQPSGTLALVDPLSQPKAWSNYSNTNLGGQCQFVNGSYQISQSQIKRIYPCEENTQYSNFAFEVKMTINQGDCGGMMIRDDGSNGKFYIFQVCQDGSYDLYKYTSYGTSSSATLTSGKSSAINQGASQSNTIAVVANGSSFDLYVNNQKIDSASDGAYNKGHIGLVAGAYNNPTTVTYQDARVWTIS
ncbi:MAG TPA: protein kinase [Ktedonobacteraceae bacterium]|nr:protein kinase [Ktedonobacteraceae bacterium]